MKNSEIITNGFSEISEKEATKLNGGGFAYDFARLLRFVGVYIGNGTGMPGTAAAAADLAANEASNNNQ